MGVFAWVLLIVAFVLIVLLFVMIVVANRKRKCAMVYKSQKTETVPATDFAKSDVVKVLSKLIRCRTVSRPDAKLMDWKEFDKLHQILKDDFPLVYQNLTCEVIGNGNLLYFWKGQNSDDEPIFLTAHQDVVPEGNTEEWEHGPFDGDVADGFVWGRGTFDVKIQIAGILAAVENLLKSGFVPKRSLYIGFGTNEEVAGDGAVKLAEELARRGIHFHMLLDEGGAVMDQLMKQIRSHVAVVGVAEKGHVNYRLSVRKKGGHSSSPANPTSLGILGRAMYRVERAQMPCHLAVPMKWFFDAVGGNTRGAFSVLFSNIWISRPLVFLIFRLNPKFAAFIRTTHAVTMCRGSEAANVISDESSAVVNVRIMNPDDFESVSRWLKKVIRDRRVKIELMKGELQSSVSPIHCEQFENLRMVINSIFDDTIAVPYFMAGGSDARFYSKICDHIYRFSPAFLDFDELGRMHNSNERLSVENCGRALDFYMTLIRRFCSED
jgi:carboxypeptidase PM20D1